MAMRQAELDEQRFSSAFGYTDMPAMANPEPPVSRPLPTHPEEQAQSSDSDYAGMDLGAMAGGFVGGMAYGTVGSPPASSGQDVAARPLPTPNTANRNFEAEMNYGDTGGLKPPTEKRMSFDDDDERVSLRSRQSGTESPNRDQLQDLFLPPRTVKSTTTSDPWPRL
ncbi:Rho guanine nucleotide exchange factor [Fusarium solani]